MNVCHPPITQSVSVAVFVSFFIVIFPPLKVPRGVTSVSQAEQYAKLLLGADRQCGVTVTLGDCYSHAASLVDYVDDGIINLPPITAILSPHTRRNIHRTILTP